MLPRCVRVSRYKVAILRGTAKGYRPNLAALTLELEATNASMDTDRGNGLLIAQNP